MKKFGILASLALCVTIGGVYAAWNYAEEDVSAGYGVSLLGITGVEGQTTKGSIKVEGTNVALKVDDTADGVVHNTKLTYNADGYFTVTFTANASASEDVRANGIDLQWRVGLATTANVEHDYTQVMFNDQQIFDEIISGATPITEAGVRDDTHGDGTVSFTYTIDMDDVYSKIDLAEIILDTEAMHNEYSEIINDYVIHLHVEEANA